MVANELLQKLVFAPAPSVFIHAFSVVSVISSAILGLSEKTGKKHLEYSKFWNATNSPKSASTQKKTQLPSRRGMLFLYVPALLVSVLSLMLFSREDIRVVLLASALAIHFFKRVFEVYMFFSYHTFSLS